MTSLRASNVVVVSLFVGLPSQRLTEALSWSESSYRMAPYPTREEIRGFAASLATDDKSPFFNRVSTNVDWEVMGTHPAAGRFKTLDEWKAGALGVVQKTLKDQIQLELVNVIGGGDEEWAVIELEANAVCKNGKKAMAIKQFDV
ncbi:hypothetical protein HII31_02143 [Pseudocercospora fuligena]|uniref:SnoaL-like domain-containing protein n=1 Tax=Pseudocercospora fuligena TaxID=685502 RepID=A0A8H6VRQ8_9PEZI|nr:hypothetical protein HII31_02143 [Pseudocercospora fuligena]